MSRFTATAFLLCILVLFVAAPAPAATLLVPSQFTTIQDACDAASAGDEIVVAPGTYPDPVVVPAIELTIRSQSGDFNDTIIDGALLAEAEILVEVAGNAAGLRVIDGFTLRNSSGVAIGIDNAALGDHTVQNCRFENNTIRSPLRAGCLWIQVLNNEFIDNSARLWGGGLQIQGNATVTGNLFRNNEAVAFGASTLTQGGAIYTVSSVGREGVTVDINNNRFENNSCTDYGGAIQITGNYNATVANNVFIGNNADACAAGVYVIGAFDYNVVIERNLFVASNSPMGAAIGVEISNNVIIRRNTIVGHLGGDGIRLQDASGINVRANIVAFSDHGAGIRFAFATGSMTCNNSFANPGGNYSGIVPVPSNISLDPLFCEQPADDYTLSAASPCLPANNSCGVFMGAFAQGCAAVPVESMTWGNLKSLFENGEQE